jgi:hypothetical protein
MRALLIFLMAFTFVAKVNAIESKKVEFEASGKARSWSLHFY